MVVLFTCAKDKLFFFLNKNCKKSITKRDILVPGYSRRNVSFSSYVDNPMKRPTLIANGKCVKNLVNGFPWLYAKDVKNVDELFLFSPCLVNIKDEMNENIGIGIYNKNSTIASRILSRNVNEYINEDFFNWRIKRAYEKRINIFPNEHFFRVVNAESDFLPGIIIDKYDKLICVQVNASGMDILLHIILKSIENILKPEIIILKNDNQIRKLEKLSLKKEVYKGLYKSPIEIRENGITFFVDILKGQKTGWYYDQRFNRSMLISYCKNKNVLDLYSYIGSFGITVAYYGAKEVTCVDSSLLAIQNGIKSAQYNNVLEKVNFVHSCVKDFLNVSLHTLLVSYGEKEETVMRTVNSPMMVEKQNLIYPPQGSTTLPNTSETREEKKFIKMDMNNSEKGDHIKQVICEKKEKKLFTDVEKIHIYGKSKQNTIDEEDISTLLLQDYYKQNFFKKKYDVILIDPPALARNNYLLPCALKIYEKLLYISFKIIQKPGYVFVSSCNKLVGYEELIFCIRRSMKWSKCEGVIIGEGKISSDHPVHISLPETRYLTSVLLMVT
ncbi:S-adenosylmethionine-dependent methyltransferase, putative [Plasmodium ovale]|uniref:RlmI-like PUA domain-containing protein n=2 Tax=Plasmodium ovale TaxID=36330 RepID=A0A1A8X067_PLAOA|nr:hypothetical protein POVCU1_035510 [Plasmodium ovale curtisi]SCP05777.1 S-adenosylmethionine-dependent methyltransferase, putative [Plasmodium ovale]